MSSISRTNSVQGMTNVGTAYVLWLGCLLQLYGLQRLYNGKIFTGLLWMFTLGLFGFGQLFDLFLIPGMVDEHNTKLRARRGLLPEATSDQPAIHRVIDQPVAPPVPQVNPDQMVVKLLRAAAARGGRITVTQAVMDTEKGFAEVEATLKELLRTGYVEIGNDPETGAVVYEFREL